MYIGLLLLGAVIQLSTATDQQAKDVVKDIAKRTASFKNQIEKLEKKFTDLYNKYLKLHAQTNRNITQQQFEKDLAEVDKRSVELLSRHRRSGACAAICIHRCIPSCNFACCVARPPGMNRHVINKLEVNAAKKNILAKKRAHKQQLLRKKLQKKKLLQLMEEGSVCAPSCLVRCEPKCKFKCCIKG